MKRILFLFGVLCLFSACRSGAALLPNVSGKAGEVVVVIERQDWEGTLGTVVRETLAADCPYLAQKEPLYSLVNVAPGAFGNLFKMHRNILYFNLDAALDTVSLLCRSDVWARPQCVVQLSAPDAERAASALRELAPRMLAEIEQAERNRVIANALLYEEKSIFPRIAEVFGGSPHFPSGYKVKKLSEHFAWVADDKQYTMQDVLLYRYPATGDADAFSLEQIVARRNEILKENVPGMFENTWMTTSTSFMPPTVEYLKYKGRAFAQTRGLWEVQNDFMGGPFVSHTFYSQDGRDILVLEAFVYAPRFDKRQYLRQVESLLYSWEWK
ncbi:MAG: DUF4837 family protein [Bacteroidales bacterium]|nr:DUF4837 family protein [Bacteroidales bacterium]